MKLLLGVALFASCGVLLAACGDSPPPVSITVAKTGSGGGTVTSSPAGIDCGATCVQAFASGTAVTLTATPDADSVFVGWTDGSCSGTGTCQVVVKDATTETAVFEKAKTGPYTVKQTQTLGGETISGLVCNITQPFTVDAVSPKVSWTFFFTPTSTNKGKVAYSYSIPSAGETHDATGTYTIAPPARDGTLTLSMAVSDHVVFKGFDGNIPLHYMFNLVVATGVTCP